MDRKLSFYRHETKLNKLFCIFVHSHKFLYNENKIFSCEVGAGSAGSVIASRLSEDGHNILLIEAGGMPPFFLNVPVITPALQESVYDWRYVTTAQIEACKGLTNNVGDSKSI